MRLNSSWQRIAASNAISGASIIIISVIKDTPIALVVFAFSNIILYYFSKKFLNEDVIFVKFAFIVAVSCSFFGFFLKVSGHSYGTLFFLVVSAASLVNSFVRAALFQKR